MRPTTVYVDVPSWEYDAELFIRSLGIPCCVRKFRDDDKANDVTLWPADEDNSQVSHWSSREQQLVLRASPEFGVFEWLYLAAHYGFAPVSDRAHDDFGVRYMNHAMLADRHRNARILTVGWACHAGATAEVIDELLWAWEMTPILTIDKKGLREHFRRKIHLAQCSRVLLLCSEIVSGWGMPVPATLFWQADKVDVAFDVDELKEFL